MNGQQWHEAKVKDFEAVSKAGAGAAPEVEGGGEEVGMGARRTRRKRMTPVGNAVGARRGAKGTNRAGNPG